MRYRIVGADGCPPAAHIHTPPITQSNRPYCYYNADLLSIKFILSLSAYCLQTFAQPSLLTLSLKMVNANSRKELQNVLPKGNPFSTYALYNSL